jgi:hypothetical protein
MLSVLVGSWVVVILRTEIIIYRMMGIMEGFAIFAGWQVMAEEDVNL